MSFVNVAPQLVSTAAADAARIGSAINTANTAAAATTQVLAAAQDEVSTAIAALFGSHGQHYQAISAQVAAYQERFVLALSQASSTYAVAEAASATPLQNVLDAINAPVQSLTGRPLIGDGANGIDGTGQAGGNGGWLWGNGGNGGSGAPGQAGGAGGAISGLLTPELRATIEAVLAKLAAPGACNPDDQTPVVDDTPDADAVRRDTRSQAQRHHDGLLAGLRGLLASGELGQHRGLPVTVVVSTTLKELEAATGKGVTGGGSRVPMSDLIRMASNAHHYLALFDGAKPLALYHTKRLASPAQRIMLYAKDRGCSRPGCDAPAYHSEVHHVTPWTTTHRTDINDLTLACGPDNRLVEKGWKTRKNAKGDTEWLPPAHLDHGQPRINRYHHPEKILCEPDDDEPH